jgi:hypothetical protein
MGTAAEGQDRRDWPSLTRLQAGDTIRLSLKVGSVKAAFRSWTPQQVVAGTVTARREDVLKIIERYRKNGWGTRQDCCRRRAYRIGFVIRDRRGGGRLFYPQILALASRASVAV